jgi:hypothetical protein
LSSVLPLAVWPHERTAEDDDAIRRAKAALNLDYRVQLSPAMPGCPTRVLALREPPPFVCDAAIVTDPTDDQKVQNALHWVLEAPEGDDRGFMVLDYLQAILGPEVREVTHDWDTNPLLELAVDRTIQR